ncbi:PREDICTED: FAD-linked sulfhydryl oxidase ERV1 [Tarenaya hassleriana]|uniref:FAD-linked sulfhydryl oxidase ERV1 n=1 Tax=Tarenaya hassleriana TaxID=28532 RepID=UPI00053C35C9|nr:PREDICTED: FAD-linked sulfhydryl oxidase ERV1 [Tarenaya hassleriana]
MSENPWQPLLQTFEKISISLQTHLSNFIGINKTRRSSPAVHSPVISIESPLPNSSSTSNSAQLPIKEKSTGPVTKEELGRATWTFLHTLAAQYPEKPTRQQKKDVKELMAILSRMYPCRECADHFKEILRANPVQAGSQEEFSQWLCHVHNTVNRSLGKLVFPCERVDARWGKLDCEQRSCDLQGSSFHI